MHLRQSLLPVLLSLFIGTACATASPLHAPTNKPQVVGFVRPDAKDCHPFNILRQLRDLKPGDVIRCEMRLEGSDHGAVVIESTQSAKGLLKTRWVPGERWVVKESTNPDNCVVFEDVDERLFDSDRDTWCFDWIYRDLKKLEDRKRVLVRHKTSVSESK